MWELEHKAGWVDAFESLRIDAFELWCWRRFLRVPWTARKSNQSILKEINPEYSLKGLKLKFQYFGHLMWRANSLEKTLMLGKIEGKRRRGWQRMRWLDSIINMDMSLSNGHEFEQTPEVGERQGSLVCCSPWGHNESDMTEWLKNNSNNKINSALPCPEASFVWLLRLEYSSPSLFFNFSLYIGVQLISNVMRVSGVQQSDSVIHIYVSILFQILPPLGCYIIFNRVPCPVQ